MKLKVVQRACVVSMEDAPLDKTLSSGTVSILPLRHLTCCHSEAFILYCGIVRLDVSGDLSHMRAVRTTSAHQFADDNGMYAFFMSAKSGDQVLVRSSL